MIGRSRVRFLVGAAGKFASPLSIFCADLFRYPFHIRVTAVNIIPKEQEAGYS